MVPIKNNTLNLIPDLLDDSDVGQLNLALVNALGIDMEWNHKFLKHYYECRDIVYDWFTDIYELIRGCSYFTEENSNPNECQICMGDLENPI